MKVLLVLVLLVVVLAMGAFLYFRSQILGEREAQRAELSAGFDRHHETFLADQKLAASLAIFSMESGKGNAGVVLTPRVGWSEEDPAVVAWRATLKEALPPRLGDALRSTLADDAWPGLSPDLADGLDLAWMATLKDYDHWDMELESPLAHTDTFAFYEAPWPDFLDLRGWAKLRYLKGIQEGELPAAIEEVRHLARLLLGSEMLLGEMVGFALLEIEDEARLHLVEAGAEVPAEWKSLDEKTRKQVRRALFATMAYTHLDTPAERAKEAANIPVGLCAGMQESGWMTVMSRPLLSDARAEDYERFGLLLEATEGRCRLRRLREAWMRGGTEEDFDALCDASRAPDGTTDEICALSAAAGWMPGMRRVIGELLFSIAIPDWWRRYDETT